MIWKLCSKAYRRPYEKTVLIYHHIAEWFRCIIAQLQSDNCKFYFSHSVKSNSFLCFNKYLKCFFVRSIIRPKTAGYSIILFVNFELFKSSTGSPSVWTNQSGRSTASCYYGTYIENISHVIAIAIVCDLKHENQSQSADLQVGNRFRSS